MECGKLEALLAVAIAKMELAKRDALEVMEGVSYPHMVPDDERSRYLQTLYGAHLALEWADKKILDTGAEIHPDRQRFPAHPEVSEQSSQDQPPACGNCARARSVIGEALLALRLARPNLNAGILGSVDLGIAMDKAIENAAQWCAVADPQWVERYAAGEREGLLEASKQIVEWWLEQGQRHFTGAPAAMFNLRAAIAKVEGKPADPPRLFCPYCLDWRPIGAPAVCEKTECQTAKREAEALYERLTKGPNA